VAPSIIQVFGKQFKGNHMIKLAVAGATGRMGQAIIRLIQDHAEIEVTAALEHGTCKYIGQDVGALAGAGSTGVIVSTTIDPNCFDVMVDFTTPPGTANHVQICRNAGKAIMVGTTGMTAQQKQTLVDAGSEIPVVLAANTSVGVNLCVALIETASRVIGDVTDIEIVEAHHKHKVDAPSGTALLLGEAAARTLGKSLDQDGVFSRHGQTGARPEGAIGFSTIRGGDIAGEHTVMFIGESERIEITHRATDRKIFAMGAVRAVAWLASQQPGFYDMGDVLGLK